MTCKVYDDIQNIPKISFPILESQKKDLYNAFLPYINQFK